MQPRMTNPEQQAPTSLTAFTDSVKIRPPPLVILRPVRHWNYRAMVQITVPRDAAKLSFQKQTPPTSGPAPYVA